MEDITMPNWREWARRLLYTSGEISLVDVANALEISFDQGIALGRRQAEQEWWQQQDAEMRMADNNVEKL